MAFELEPISDPKVLRSTANFLGVYNGQWAIDHSLNAFLYFDGNDTHDPQEPHSYVFAVDGHIFHLEMIDSRYSSEDERREFGQLFFIVLGGNPVSGTENQINLRPVIEEAIKVLTGKTAAEYRFVHSFRRAVFSEVVHLPSTSKASLSNYLDPLLPIGFFLVLGLLVLLFESHKH